MFKKLICGFALTYLTLFFSPNLFAAEIKIEAKQIAYDLPYPGILPDSQLYFLKIARDSILEFFTRDYLKKAQVNLLLADKKLAMATDLSKKNKWTMAKKVMEEAEGHYTRAIDNMEQSKKQGASPSGDFVLKVKLSNEKNREVIENLLKNAPNGDVAYFEEILKSNKEINQKLVKL